MVRSSRLAHDGSTWLSWLAGPGRSGPQVVLVVRCTAQLGPYPIGVERARDAERPRERRAALGTGKALRNGMQPCTTPGEPPPRVRDANPVHRNDPQQVVGHHPGATPDAGPNRPSVGSRLTAEVFLPCGISARAWDRSQVYRVPCQRGSVPGVRAAAARSPTGAPDASAPVTRGPRRCGCRSASRSAGRRAGRSAPPCRSPGRAGSPARSPGPSGSRASTTSTGHDLAPATARCRRTWPGRPTSR